MKERFPSIDTLQMDLSIANIVGIEWVLRYGFTALLVCSVINSVSS